MNELPWTIPGGQQVQFTPYRIGGRNGSAATVINSGTLESENFVTGSAGWRILGNGNVEFESGEFRGDITGASGAFSGTVAAANITAGNLASDVINTGVLDADDITTGNLAASIIATTALNADNITSGNISASIIDTGTLTSIAINNGSGTFTVDASGNLTASSGTFSGTVNAASFTGGGSLPNSASNTLKSGNFSTGVSGWQITGDGNAEFNNVTARGTLEMGSDGAQISDGTRFSLVYGSVIEGTEWLGPDFVGTGTQPYVGMYTDFDTEGLSWSGYLEMQADAFYIKARDQLTIEPNLDVTDALTVGDNITAATAAVQFGTGGGFPGSWTAYEGLFHKDLASGYMMMSNGTDTFIGSDSNTYIRPAGNGGASYEFDSAGAKFPTTYDVDVNASGGATPAFYSNWSNFAGSWQNVRITRDPVGVITICGLVSRSTSASGAPNAILLTPSWARVAKQCMFICIDSTGAAVRVDLYANGQVVTNTSIAAGAWINLNLSYKSTIAV
jgi:hypothetical protein